MGAPCKGCEERRISCHDRCERYNAYKTENEMRKKQCALNTEYNAMKRRNVTEMKHKTAPKALRKLKRREDAMIEKMMEV